MKPSAETIYRWMQKMGRWVRTEDIIRNCPTVTPSKRISELRDLGLIETRQRAVGSGKEYRAI
jgi:hypothetical protein